MYIETGEYIGAAYQAHSDLVDFVEVGRLFDFKTWLEPMRNRLEEGIQVYIFYLFYVLFSNYIIFIFIRTISYWNLNEWVRKFLSGQKKIWDIMFPFRPADCVGPLHESRGIQISAPTFHFSIILDLPQCKSGHNTK